MYLSRPTSGYHSLPVLPNKNPSENGRMYYLQLSSGVTLQSSKIKCEVTKVHCMCPNEKQQIVSG